MTPEEIERYFAGMKPVPNPINYYNEMSNIIEEKDVSEEDFDKLSMMLSKRTTTQRQIDTLFRTAIMTNKSEDILDLLLGYIDIDHQVNIPPSYGQNGVDGWTQLMTAVNYVNYRIVRYLLRRGANPNITNSNGDTALHYALKTPHCLRSKQMIEYLAYVTNTDIKDNNGETPLIIASKLGITDIVTYLVHNKKVDVSVTNNQGKSAYDLAGNDEIKSILERSQSFRFKSRKSVRRSRKQRKSVRRSRKQRKSVRRSRKQRKSVRRSRKQRKSVRRSRKQRKSVRRSRKQRKSVRKLLLKK